MLLSDVHYIYSNSIGNHSLFLLMFILEVLILIINEYHSHITYREVHYNFIIKYFIYFLHSSAIYFLSTTYKINISMVILYPMGTYVQLIIKRYKFLLTVIFINKFNIFLLLWYIQTILIITLSNINDLPMQFSLTIYYLIIFSLLCISMANCFHFNLLKE